MRETVAVAETEVERVEAVIGEKIVAPADFIRSGSFSSVDLKCKSVEPEHELQMPSAPDEEDDGMKGVNEVKIDIEGEDKVDNNSPAALIDPSTTVEIPIDDEQSPTTTKVFTQEKDAPEVSTRVYDFNMVKQKTLPRINFNTGNRVFQACSSHPKAYISAITLIGVSLLIGTLVMIWYLTV